MKPKKRIARKQPGKKAKGRSELARHLKGQRLTRHEAIQGKCYDCMGGYSDGLNDCQMESCTLHPFMPYKEDN